MPTLLPRKTVKLTCSKSGCGPRRRVRSRADSISRCYEDEAHRPQAPSGAHKVAVVRRAAGLAGENAEQFARLPWHRRTGVPGRSSSHACAGTRAARLSSTPSAITSRSRLLPMSMMVRTMAASFESTATSRTKDWSIFRVPIGKLLQGRQRRIAGAEIVDGQVQAHGIQLVQQADGALRIGHQGGFRDFQLEAGGRDAVLAEHAAAAGDEARLLELPQREIDRDSAGLRHGFLPLAVVRADAVQNPLADIQYQAGFFGQRNEMRGRNVAVAGQAPAQQRLGADHAAGAQIHLGLIQDHQFVALQRAPQLALQHQPLDRRGIHAGHVERAGIAAVLLRVIHRRIGIADQIDHVLRIVGADGDADAGGQVHLLLVHVEGAADFIEQGARQGSRWRRGCRRPPADRR